MIIIIEGAQGSGKTHLINSLKRNLKIADEYTPHEFKNVIFYKYKHVEYMDKLEFNDIEGDESFHYFTISNTLTILGLRDLVMSDKVFVFDRGIFSAYVWSILRKRLDTDRLKKELTNLLNLDSYNNCHIIRIKSNTGMKRDHTDIFDKHANVSLENNIFDQLFNLNMELINNSINKNSFTEITNKLDKISEIELFQTFRTILNKN